MSASARRLTRDVPVDRITWPTPETVGAGPKAAPAGQPIRRLRIPEHGAAPPSPEAAARVTAVEREAFAKGYEQGERAGEQAAGTRSEAMLRRLVATIEEIASLRAGMMRQTERELVRLAVAMAERIVRREVEVDAELLMAMAHVAIDRLGADVAATIHLHPADHEAIMTARKGAAFTGAVQVVADPTVSRGGCLVKSAFGVVDAGIDTQIREISQALVGEDTAATKPHGTPTGA